VRFVIAGVAELIYNSGTELVALAATEHPDPQRALPAAVKMTFWRVTVSARLCKVVVLNRTRWSIS
jgi:amino acid permease